jgi:hypothetical protein
MNKTQKRIIFAWMILVVLLFCFPHYHIVAKGTKIGAGLGFILTGPFERNYSIYAVVDTPLLAIMELMATAIAGVWFFITKDRPSQGDPPKCET